MFLAVGSEQQGPPYAAWKATLARRTGQPPSRRVPSVPDDRKATKGTTAKARPRDRAAGAPYAIR